MTTTHTPHRALAALAATAAVALTGVALAPAPAHAAITTPSVYVADADRATAPGQPVRFTATGFPADTAVIVSLSYRDATASGGQSIGTLLTDASGRLIDPDVTVPSDLGATFYSTTPDTTDVLTVATADDSAQASDIVRIGAALPTVTVSKSVITPGDRLHMHVTGLWPGEHAVASVADSSSNAQISIGGRPDGTRDEWVANSAGVVDADITVPDPRADEYADVDALLDSSTTVLDVDSLGSSVATNPYGVTATVPLRLDGGAVSSTPAGPPSPPATCPRPIVKGGPVVCLYAGGDSYSGHPGDTAYVAGYRWSPGSTVTLWATQGCTIDVQGTPVDESACTINGGLGQWDVGTSAVEIGTATVVSDGSMDPRAVTLPALPASWYSRGVTVVAVGRHTAIYPVAEDSMGSSTNGFVWLAPDSSPDPTPTPTPSPTPTPTPTDPVSPTPTPSPTHPSNPPASATPAPTPTRKPTPTPSTPPPTPRRSTTTPPPTPSPHTPAARPTPSRSVGTPLASTGTPTGDLVGGAAMLLALGVLAMFAGRKRDRPARRT